MREQSSCMNRILPILTYRSIKDLVWHLVDFDRENIDWERLNYRGLSGGQKTALTWLYLLWTDHLPPAEWNWRSPFDGFGNLDPELAARILKAFAQRHEVSLRSSETRLEFVAEGVGEL